MASDVEVAAGIVFRKIFSVIFFFRFSVRKFSVVFLATIVRCLP